MAEFMTDYKLKERELAKLMQEMVDNKKAYIAIMERANVVAAQMVELKKTDKGGEA
jgi:hypothetical protein